MSIKIPVSAQFDAADVKKQIQIINDQIKILSNTVAMAQNKKFEPVTLKSKEDLAAFTAQMQKLLKIQTELQQKMGSSGQAGKNPFLADWSKMYGDKGTRIQKMMSALQFMGVEFDDHPAPKPKPPAVVPPANSGRPPANNGGGWPPPGGWGQQGLNVMNSGLNAMGPVGGVFSNAMRSGMNAGAGAGLMGLVGGLAALGVGKLIGAIADKIDSAQQQNITLGQLMRANGSRTSFRGTNMLAYGSANELGMGINDYTQFMAQYQRSSAFRGSPQELIQATQMVGQFGRGYGLDPNEAGGMFASASKLNIARDQTSMQKLGIWLGEGVGKSGAFTSIGDMMGALTSYMESQARYSMSDPNAQGYLGQMSALVASGMPGADVQGVSAMLSRANSAVQQGGAFGMPSQMFSARMGMANGLKDPFQLGVFEEGGLFATKSSMIGKNSMYGKIFGSGGEGNTTQLEMIRDQMAKNYGKGTPMYYEALRNHLGISRGQAMMLDQYKGMDLTTTSNALSGMGIDISKINPNSIKDLVDINAKGQAKTVAGRLLAGNDLTDNERKRLSGAMAAGDDGELKKITSELVASHGTEKNEGEKTRDSISKLDNTFQQYADKALPHLNMMRMALVQMAGGSEKSIRNSYFTQMRKEQVDEISDKYKGKFAELSKRRQALLDAGKGRREARGLRANGTKTYVKEIIHCLN